MVIVEGTYIYHFYTFLCIKCKQYCHTIRDKQVETRNFKLLDLDQATKDIMQRAVEAKRCAKCKLC